jgi:hypothetical protein
MDTHLRELLEKAKAGELSETEAMQVVADARRSVLADQASFLQNLNAILAAEEAMLFRAQPSTKLEYATNGEPSETYRGVEIYSILLGVHSTRAIKTAGLTRYKCAVNSATLIGNTHDAIRSMIDEALGASSDTSPC